MQPTWPSLAAQLPLCFRVGCQSVAGGKSDFELVFACLLGHTRHISKRLQQNLRSAGLKLLHMRQGRSLLGPILLRPSRPDPVLLRTGRIRPSQERPGRPGPGLGKASPGSVGLVWWGRRRVRGPTGEGSKG